MVVGFFFWEFDKGQGSRVQFFCFGRLGVQGFGAGS